MTEIEKKADEFCKKWFPEPEYIFCICGAKNCINNDTCIKCNKNLK